MVVGDNVVISVSHLHIIFAFAQGSLLIQVNTCSASHQWGELICLLKIALFSLQHVITTVE